jgi:hypothetical protein
MAGAAVVTSRARPRPLAVLAWTLWAVAMAILALIPVSDQLLRNAGRPDLVQFTSDTIPPFLSAVSAATVGAVLAHRRPRHPVGWLLLALTTCLVASGVISQYVVYDQLIGPDALPAIRYVVRFYPATAIAASGLLGFVLLLTPTGALPSPRWRWWANATVAALVVCLAGVMLLPGAADPRDLVKTSPFDDRSFTGALRLAIQVGAAVGALTMVVAAGSLAARFRYARGVERQQLRWVAVAAALIVLAGAVALAGVAISAPGDVAGWAVCVVPMTLGAAVLRYRLYDLDHIISRTLAYGLLTLLLGGCYAGTVLALGQLAGRTSSLAVAGATLAVAALFGPARRRIQTAVDQRFNRRRYDVEHTLEEFRARQQHEIEIEAVSADLLAVITETMQPTRASLWLRRDDATSPPARAHVTSRHPATDSGPGPERPRVNQLLSR